jgi:hypothetical protein
MAALQSTKGTASAEVKEFIFISKCYLFYEKLRSFDVCCKKLREGFIKTEME